MMEGRKIRLRRRFLEFLAVLQAIHVTIAIVGIATIIVHQLSDALLKLGSGPINSRDSQEA